MADEKEVNWLTQEAYDNLVAELNYLKTEGRRAVAAKIGRARDEGDLSENAGYHAAREEQGQMEARILQLAALVDNAQVGEVDASAGVVHPGMQVTIYYDGDPEDEDTFLLGSRELLALDDSVDLDVYSPQSPIGKAVTGAKVGETVSYAAPNGKTIDVTIVSVSA